MRWSFAALLSATARLPLVRAMSSSPTVDSSSLPQGALIFLHGLGDTPAGWESTIRDELPRMQPRLSNLIYRFPHAPVIPISINGNAEMTGWFDLYDWPIDTSAREDRRTVKQSVQMVRSEIATVMREYPHLSRKQILVGGFSQGGAVALVAAYHSQYGVPEGLGGCVNLSGWWPLGTDEKNRREDDGTRLSVEQQAVPLFWGHGRWDDKVLFEHQASGIQYLREVGLRSEHIQAEQYPIGHSSDSREIRALADFIDRVIFGSPDSTIAGAKKATDRMEL